jgi:hypothetical protein
MSKILRALGHTILYVIGVAWTLAMFAVALFFPLAVLVIIHDTFVGGDLALLHLQLGHLIVFAFMFALTYGFWSERHSTIEFLLAPFKGNKKQ